MDAAKWGLSLSDISSDEDDTDAFGWQRIEEDKPLTMEQEDLLTKMFWALDPEFGDIESDAGDGSEEEAPELTAKHFQVMGMAMTGAKVSLKECEAQIARADLDLNGGIDLDEWLVFATPLSRLPPDVFLKTVNNYIRKIAKVKRRLDREEKKRLAAEEAIRKAKEEETAKQNAALLIATGGSPPASPMGRGGGGYGQAEPGEMDAAGGAGGGGGAGEGMKQQAEEEATAGGGDAGAAVPDDAAADPPSNQEPGGGGDDGGDGGDEPDG
jgi:hypothetical protein